MHNDGRVRDPGFELVVVVENRGDISLQCSRRNVDGTSVLSTLWQGGLIELLPPMGLREWRLIRWSSDFPKERGLTPVGRDEEFPFSVS